MKDVRFVVDYRGQHTGEVFYTAGTVARFTDGVAAALVADGRAVDAVGLQEAHHEATTPEPLPTMPTDWTAIDGVDEVIAVSMLKMGLNTPADVLDFVAMGGNLRTIHNVGKIRAADIVEWAEDNL